MIGRLLSYCDEMLLYIYWNSAIAVWIDLRAEGNDVIVYIKDV